MSQGSGSTLTLGVMVALLWAGLGFAGFYAGGSGAREAQASQSSKLANQRTRAIEAGIADERQATSKLRLRVAELERQIAAVDSRVIAGMERDLAQRRKQSRPFDALVLDESLDITGLAERIGREAVGEELAGATLEVVKGRRSFLLELTLPPEPSEPAALTTLSESLSELPQRVQRSWITHVGLKAEGQQALYFKIGTISPEAWGVLLRTFRLPHHRVRGHGSRNSGLYRIAGLSLSYKLEAETTLELYGPQRVTKTLHAHGSSAYIRVKGGTYVLHAHAEGQVPFLGVLELRNGHMTQPHLASKP